MSDLRLNSAGELTLTPTQLVTGSDAVAQHCAQRLRTVRGEWVFDRRVGTPYIEQIFGKRDMADVEGVFRQVILTTPGVESIQSFTSSLDTATRALSINVSIRLVDLTLVTLVLQDLLMEVSD
jgi:hypothetical protein